MKSSNLDLHKSQTPEGFFRFGSVAGVFGFKGEAKFFLYNPETPLMGQWVRVAILEGQQIGEALDVFLRTGAGKKIIAKIKQNGEMITSEEAVRALMGKELVCSNTLLPKLEDGEFYHQDLLGMSVVNEEKEFVGTIVEITPGNVDIFSIQLKKGAPVIYVPFTEKHVLSISSKEMVIRSYDTTADE